MERIEPSSSFGGRNMRNSDDHGFKTVISNADILAMLIKEYIPGFEGKELEEIKGCLDMEEGANKVRGREIEFHTEDGCIIMDSSFDLKVPGGPEKTVKVALESQSRVGKRERLFRRMQLYGSTMMSSQMGKEFVSPHYEGALDVYTIWIILNPTMEFCNKVDSYCLRNKEGMVMGGTKSPMPGINITIVGLGEYGDENINDKVRFVTMLLAPKIDKEERHRVILDNYNIQLNESILRGVDRIMSFTENSLDAAECEGALKEHQRDLESTVKMLMAMIDSGIVDVNRLEEVPMENDLREALREELHRRESS